MKHCDKLAVTVNPTNRCNLRCGYCMASSSDEQDNPMVIDIEFAKKGIEDAIRGYPSGVKVTTLRFFSPGEPTQEMDIVRSCVEHARKLKPDIKTELQTNGLFETPEDTNWIAKNFDIVWFSLDGPPEINDKNRPDKYGKGRTLEIEKNMEIVGGRTAIGVRSTVEEEIFDKQITLVEYYHKKGIKILALNPVIYSIPRRDRGKCSVTKSDIMKFAEGFIHACKRADEYGMDLLNSLTFNFDEPTNIGCRSCIPVPQLNPDDSVSSCDMALYHDTKEELKCFIYGTWDRTKKEVRYYLDRIEHLSRRKLENLPVCKNCEIGQYCAGGCAGRIAFQTGDIYDVIPEYCVATKYLAKNMALGQKRMKYTHP